jgi:hypothetical protein
MQVLKVQRKAQLLKVKQQEINACTIPADLACLKNIA